MHSIGIAVIAALMMSCPLRASADTELLTSQRADELRAADQAFGTASAKLEGRAGLKAAFAKDVIMPVPGKSFANGREEVLSALKANSGIDAAHIEWAPVRVGISADASQGFSFGFMDQHQADGTSLGFKYLAYWQHQGNAWKIVAWKRVKRAYGKIDRRAMPALLPGSFPAQATPPALEAAEQAFSDEAQTLGLGPAFAKFGSAESMNLGGSGNAGFVFGAKAIAQLVSAGQADGGSTLNWSADRVIVAASGDLGISIGRIRFNAPVADGSDRRPIPFFTIWRRAAADQPWRYVAE
ncbi:MAG TPA: hypothetical protein VFN25_01705 [Dokdonella sp.]|uniref:hypothetical protein n=1 Tax=Dokdonella sp. TaxID=2291710 RepID=UPI002D7E9EE7|nr:hypothetical protein [Dokdonella sp.]HET9031599.1 hypothetical protein [Dokdonella sp.]